MLNHLRRLGNAAVQQLGHMAAHLFGAGGFRMYDPRTHGIYDLKKELVVPHGQAIYDPMVFGRYDLASQKVVSKSGGGELGLTSYDVLMAEAQRYAKGAPLKLETDRYTLAISLLDPGTGICLDACTPTPLAWVRQHVSQLGYEYAPVDINGDGTEVKRENLLHLSFADGSISRILSLDTLEHIEDYGKALAEFYRVLKDDGVAILHVPCYYFEKAASEPIRPAVDPWGHVRYFSARELVERLAAAGFIILRLAYNFDYGAVVCVTAKSTTTTGGPRGR
jgi:SAM-dependent methyltransferase